jgi:hypothetical protein
MDAAIVICAFVAALCFAMWCARISTSMWR